MAEASKDRKLYKIGEVCRIADVQPYVLRYWETEFAALAPNKSGGGQRLYTQREIDTVLRIKLLLYTEGFTIAGAKKKLEAELSAPAPPAPAATEVREPPTQASRPRTPAAEKALLEVKRELAQILTLLDD